MALPPWIVPPLTAVEIIASGRGIRELGRLRRAYGGRNWRKKKGFATVRIDGKLLRAEVHWYEAHGIGAVEHKIKTLL
ncbi:MAG: hypothetical protein ACK5TK_18050 [Betaproteobacteria bacterium]